MTEPTAGAASSSYGVHSEVGRLRKVLVCAPGLAHRYQAVFVFPDPEKGLDVAAVDARDWRAIGQLGWEWLTGDWVAARAVTKTRTPELRLKGTRRVLALFDGEQVTLEPSVAITGGTSLEAFIATRKEE